MWFMVAYFNQIALGYCKIIIVVSTPPWRTASFPHYYFY